MSQFSCYNLYLIPRALDPSSFSSFFAIHTRLELAILVLESSDPRLGGFWRSNHSRLSEHVSLPRPYSNVQSPPLQESCQFGNRHCQFPLSAFVLPPPLYLSHFSLGLGFDSVAMLLLIIFPHPLPTLPPPNFRPL